MPASTTVIIIIFMSTMNPPIFPTLSLSLFPPGADVRQEAEVLGSARWSGISRHTHPLVHLVTYPKTDRFICVHVRTFVARQIFFSLKHRKYRSLNKTQ